MFYREGCVAVERATAGQAEKAKAKLESLQEAITRARASFESAQKEHAEAESAADIALEELRRARATALLAAEEKKREEEAAEGETQADGLKEGQGGEEPPGKRARRVAGTALREETAVIDGLRDKLLANLQAMQAGGSGAGVDEAAQWTQSAMLELQAIMAKQKADATAPTIPTNNSAAGTEAADVDMGGGAPAGGGGDLVDPDVAAAELDAVRKEQPRG